MSGAIKLPHTCPKCKVTTAKTHKELTDLFGLRSTTPDTATNQSWCKKCR